jgi:hypothetical protein
MIVAVAAHRSPHIRTIHSAKPPILISVQLLPSSHSITRFGLVTAFVILSIVENIVFKALRSHPAETLSTISEVPGQRIRSCCRICHFGVIAPQEPEDYASSHHS